MTLGWRNIVLFALYAVVTAAIVWRAPIPQPASYHGFADDRTIWGIANFFNVVSNAAFLIPGVVGLRFCLRQPPSGARWSWTTLFLGVSAVAAGSTYYHLAPDDGTLFWDRLPMTVGFTALLVAMLDEYVADRAERYILLPAVALGFASLLYWMRFGDLSVYFWMQAISLGTVVTVLAVHRGRGREHLYLLAAVLAYGAAIICEQADRALWAMLGQELSGHTIKHLLAALGLYQLFRMLRDRART